MTDYASSVVPSLHAAFAAESVLVHCTEPLSREVGPAVVADISVVGMGGVS